MLIRDATEADFESLLRLNAESVHFLSPLSIAELRTYHAAAACDRVVCSDDTVQAFLLAFRDGASYNGEHYRWFAERYASFLYIDRVVVDRTLQGRGVGSALYRDVFAVARRLQVPWVTCEIDVDPPNHGSLAFHARFGFTEVGRHDAAGGVKRVSLQVAPATAG